MGENTVVIFDFDRTIIDDDSDRWVVSELGLTHLFNQLRSTLPWTSLMDRMMKELHSQGITTNHIADCLKRAYLHPSILSAIKSAHALGWDDVKELLEKFCMLDTGEDLNPIIMEIRLSPTGCDSKIISDANTFYIKTILEHHGVWDCFSEVNTNPTYVDEEGRLRITPFHDSTLSPHACHLCPPNMCKGLVIDRILGSLPENRRRFIYIGDGIGDYCPTLKLEGGDFVMPRKDYPLWNRISSDPKLVNAEVHEWSSGEELESILLNLINKLAIA